MKNIIKTLFIGLMFIGCSSMHSTTTNDEYNNAPKWVKSPYIQGYITGIGIASPNAGNNIGFQRDIAIDIATNKLAKTIETKVESFLDNFEESVEVQDKKTFRGNIQRKIRTVIRQKVSGARVKDSWISKNGNFYVLMVIKTKNIINAIKHDVKLKDKDKEFQRFLSEKGDEELEKSLENG